jgi:hypothetical protein
MNTNTTNMKIYKSFFKNQREFEAEKDYDKKFEEYSKEARKAFKEHASKMHGNKEISHKEMYESSLTLNDKEKYSLLKEEFKKQKESKETSIEELYEKRKDIALHSKLQRNDIKKIAALNEEIKHKALSNFFKDSREENKPREEIKRELLRHVNKEVIKEVVTAINKTINEIEKPTKERAR